MLSLSRLVVLAASLICSVPGTLAALQLAAPDEAPPRAAIVVSDDVLEPLDLSEADSLPVARVARTVVDRPHAEPVKLEGARVWRCSAPRALATDETGTVRVCGWIAE